MIETDREEKRLAKKVNMLIDKVEDKSREIGEKKKKADFLQKEIKKLEAETDTKHAADEEELIEFLKDFCLIARAAYMEDAYIKYSYATKNSDFFYKIEKNIFDEYVCNNSRFDIKKFVSNCVDLSLVKAEKSRRCIYPSGAIQVYYLSRPFIDKILEPVLQQA